MYIWSGMFKFIFKWAFRLALLGFITTVILVVAFILSLDSILRSVAEHNLRSNTGMYAEIGQFHLGLTEPVIVIKNLKIYNAPEFGGAPFLEIPEIYVEYDRAALQRGQLHLKLLRFNLGELDIVKNEAGRLNLTAFAPPAKGAKPAAPDDPMHEFSHRTGLTFQQIDVLNVSVGRFKYIDLKDPRNNREQKVDIENAPARNVKSRADLAGLDVLLALRSGNFFTDLLVPKSGKSGWADLLQLF